MATTSSRLSGKNTDWDVGGDWKKAEIRSSSFLSTQERPKRKKWKKINNLSTLFILQNDNKIFLDYSLLRLFWGI